MFHTIYYASRTLDDAQKNYTTTKTMILAMFLHLECLGITWYCLRLLFLLITLLLSFSYLSRRLSLGWSGGYCCCKNLTWRLRAKRGPKIWTLNLIACRWWDNQRDFPLWKSLKCCYFKGILVCWHCKLLGMPGVPKKYQTTKGWRGLCLKPRSIFGMVHTCLGYMVIIW